jgi:hypothetical protein
MEVDLKERFPSLAAEGARLGELGTVEACPAGFDI